MVGFVMTVLPPGVRTIPVDRAKVFFKSIFSMKIKNKGMPKNEGIF